MNEKKSTTIHHIQTKPDYGFDGSPIRLQLISLTAWLLSILLLTFSNPPLKILGAVLLVIALLLTLLTIKLLYYVHVGKLRLRQRLLSMVNWQGNETVLDIGTGHGLLMIGAAKMLSNGKSIGIDIWRQEDMANNNPQATLKNAELEGVIDKVEVLNEDVQNMTFPDANFDVVLSNLCIHNIPSKQGRDKACQEIVRVLKPHGIVLIADIIFLKDYAEIFQNAGLSVEIIKSSFLEVSTPWHAILKVS